MADQNVNVSIAGQTYAVAVSIGGGVPNPTGWYSVKAYGAVGDGVANDTTAIQAAIDAAEAAGGGTVFFPAGQYKVNASIAIASATDLTLEMYGAKILQTAPAAPSTPTKTFLLSGTCSNVRFMGGTILGQEAIDGSGLITVGHTGIQHTSGGTYSRTHVRDMHFEQLSIGCGLGEETSQAITNSSVVNCTFKNILGEASGSGYAIHLNGYDLLADGCHIENGCRHDIYCAKGGRMVVKGCISKGHRTSYNNATYRPAIQIARVRDVSVTGCEVYDFYDGAIAINGVDVDLSDCANVSVTGCTFSVAKNAVAAVQIGEQAASATYFLKGLTFTGNVIDMSGSTGTQRCLVFNNGISINISGNCFVMGDNLVASHRAIIFGNGTYTSTDNTADISISDNRLLADEASASYAIYFMEFLGAMIASAIPVKTHYNTYQSIGTAPLSFTMYYAASAITNTAWSVAGTGDTRSVRTATADDATPSVVGSRVLLIPSNTGATAITQLDDSVAGQQVTLVATNATNPSTLADGATFILAGGAAWAPGIDDTITLFTANGGASAVWREVCRSDN